MKKSTQYLFIGCGSGCLLIVLAVAAMVIGGVRLTQSTVEGFESAVERRAALEERFGETKDFTPWPDGAVPPDRMEVFLAVRDATAPARHELAAIFEALPTSADKAQEIESQPFTEKMRSIFDITKSSMGLGAEMGHFFDARNQALLDAGMGLGEYTYIFALAYYVALDHALEETGEGIPMPNMASGRIHRELAGMLRNQLAALPADADPAWRERLAEEIAALDSDAERLPWQDGLPEAIASSIEPHRERLETSYSPEINPFELTRNVKKGKMSFEAE